MGLQGSCLPENSQVKEKKVHEYVDGLPDDGHGVAQPFAHVPAHLEGELNVVVGVELEEDADEEVLHQVVVEELMAGQLDYLDGRLCLNASSEIQSGCCFRRISPSTQTKLQTKPCESNSYPV